MLAGDKRGSMATPQFVGLLREHMVALCIAETAGKWPLAEDVTADFVYVRLHGAEQMYISGYTDEQLDGWAARVHAWAKGEEPADARRVDGPSPRKEGRDVYVYFDNTDVKQRSPFDALALIDRLGLRANTTLPPPPKLATARLEFGEKGSAQAVKQVSKKRVKASRKSATDPD